MAGRFHCSCLINLIWWLISLQVIWRRSVGRERLLEPRERERRENNYACAVWTEEVGRRWKEKLSKNMKMISGDNSGRFGMLGLSKNIWGEYMRTFRGAVFVWYSKQVLSEWSVVPAARYILTGPAAALRCSMHLVETLRNLSFKYVRVCQPNKN
jgi:hypothetical protein